MSDVALAMEGVTRRFGKKIALDRFDLEVRPGEVVGVVGRNAAGKTTTLRLAHGYLYPDEGTIRTLDLDPVREGRAVRERVGLMGEEQALYDWMTVQEHLDLAAALHPRWDAKLASRYLARLELDPAERVKTMSRGTRAKLALVIAVAPAPELLLLDDPTAGLDPLVRREVLEGILDAISDRGGAVVYASHLVHDLERVADRVAVLDGGRKVIDDSLERLKERVCRVTGVFEGDAPALPAALPRIDARADGRMLSVVTDAPDDVARALSGLGSRNVERDALPLEEILVACLRRENDDPEAASNGDLVAAHRDAGDRDDSTTGPTTGGRA